jgi:aldehyde:ferredoxin oxidoreductase
MSGYTGKILRLNLTTREITTIDTSRYEQWMGGHGMGSAIFWDLVKDKAIDGFDARNVVTIMTSPLSGTLAPGASGRTEVQGIGVQSWPVGWFTRSNFGGRFGAMLKFAGWDGIVIEGKADQPIWVDIRNGDVEIKDAHHLWGLDTWRTQEEIWKAVIRDGGSGGWVGLNTGDDGPRTTQRPAVLTIGLAGENLSRIACLIHDAGNSAGQGGFGGIWGSKNLKAISVFGTGSVEIADPNALMEARLWAQKWYGLHVDHRFGDRKPQIGVWDRPEKARLQACFGCHEGCRERSSTGLGNESSCVETDFYAQFDKKKHGRQTEAAYIGADLLQKYGVNAFEAWRGLEYVVGLYQKGKLGPGKQIDCDLEFDQLGEVEFAEKFIRMIAYREGIGDDFAEGFVRAAERWGRLEEDLGTGLLRYSYWGLPTHSYDPRAEVSWGYGSILGDRDINEHGLNQLFWWSSSPKWEKKTPPIPAELVVKLFAENLTPFENDPLMLDYSTENIYSHHMAKLVAWHRHYTRFWKQSALFCDLRWSLFLSDKTPDHRGIAGEGEPRFLNAVTGKTYSFSDGIEIGKKIWNLDNAIWALQGRHRDMVHFADHIYEVPYSGLDYESYHLPGRKNGEWDYIRVNGRKLDRAKFEEFKTEFYKLEGWDASSGWPTRDTLEELNLKYVADELETKGKLGS